MGNVGDVVQGHRVEIKTEDGWVFLPNAKVTFDVETDEPDDFDSHFKLSATTSTYTFSVAPVHPETYALITGQKAPTGAPIYDSLVEERINYWKGMK